MSHTSPILNLAIIHQLALLHDQFAKREGRRIAKSLGLKTTGVLGILLRARREGKIPSLRVAMDELRERAWFYIATDLYVDLLRESREVE